jgi:hypothetical protein
MGRHSSVVLSESASQLSVSLNRGVGGVNKTQRRAAAVLGSRGSDLQDHCTPVRLGPAYGSSPVRKQRQVGDHPRAQTVVLGAPIYDVRGLCPFHPDTYQRSCLDASHSCARHGAVASTRGLVTSFI